MEVGGHKQGQEAVEGGPEKGRGENMPTCQGLSNLFASLVQASWPVDVLSIVCLCAM